LVLRVLVSFQDRQKEDYYGRVILSKKEEEEEKKFLGHTLSVLELSDFIEGIIFLGASHYKFCP